MLSWFLLFIIWIFQVGISWEIFPYRFSRVPNTPQHNTLSVEYRKKVKNDYIKAPLEIKRGFLVYINVLLIYCILESFAC